MLSLLFTLALTGPPPRVAVDTSVARILAEAQVKHETRLACLYGEFDPASNTMSFDRVQIADACPAEARGVVGFIDGAKYDQNDVTAKMVAVLHARPGLWVAGEAHDIERVWNGSGWQLAAKVWFAVQTPEMPVRSEA